MLKEKLEKWAELLLDTGKRNNLINFKTRYTSVAEIVYPSSRALFDKALADEFFEPISLADGERSFPCDGMEDDDLKSWFVESYSSKVRRSSDVLLYTGEQKTLSTIKNIMKKSKLALEETGVNIAYLAFGFIHWFDRSGGEEMLAPILLIPITFEKKGLNKFPKIDVLESEITLNPSFCYKCEKEFGIELPEYSMQPLDEYLTLVAEAVEGHGWFISNECRISTFSFLKINMYRDVEDNRERILENENVKILLGNAPYDRTIPVCDSEALHCIVDADSSQEEAIRAVKSGKSLVLQGPPGTGKSQTITNIIAECLADGKKVLFVSEKLAALNVVYEKLKKEGLSEFCLELHSHKANKKDFLNDICKVLKSERFVASERVERELGEKILAEDTLNEYKKQLHIPRENIGMSVYELINGYYENKSSVKVLYNVSNSKSISRNTLEERVNILEEYKSYAESLCRDYRKFCFYGYKDTDSSFSKIQRTKENAKALEGIFEEAQTIKVDLANDYRLSCNNLSELFVLGSLLSFLGSSSVMTPEIIKSPNIILSSVNEMEQVAARIKTLENEFKGVFSSAFFSDRLSVNKVKDELVNNFASFTSRAFSSRYKKIIKMLSKHLLSGKKLDYISAIYYSEKIQTYYLLKDNFNANDGVMKNAFGSAYVGVDSDWNFIKKDITTFLGFKPINKFINLLASLSNEDFFALQSKFVILGERIINLSINAEGILRYFESVLEDKNSFRLRYLSDGKAYAKRIYDNIAYLPEWINLIKLISRAKSRGVKKYLDAYLDGDFPVSEMAIVYRREVYRVLAETFIFENPMLSSFTRTAHDKTVERFMDKDLISLEANKVKIRAFLASKRPDLSYIAPNSEVSMLLHEGAKKRLQKSVRRLLSEAGESIQLLKPCFLMSPLSVSTFLSSGEISFDVVIFDEASQIFPQDAIGAIYRGKQLVVVGDSKQMPPSNFFMNTVTGAIDDDNAEDDISDFESILDICSATFAQKYLRWHYRSKHESLIAFSNSKFYDGKLVSFPSTKKSQTGLGIDYYYAGGTYEQNQRINRKEAELIADLVFEHFDKRPNLSIGVVAFNMSQQNHIEKVIANRRAAHPEYEKFFKEDNKEYFFVKNLETVQGDERDVIIFSIAYAYNRDGKFVHNFGPLNHEGGERRLNVAITRAKQNIKLVASIHASDIDLARTNAEGAKLLKEYLEYAEFGILDKVSSGASAERDGFEDQVADFIRSKGYSVERKLGESSAKIDIAIKGEDGEEFTLAVECDGSSYARYTTARDRDRLRRQILERSGWKYYRVWSVEWFKNRGAEEAKLLKFLRHSVALGVKNFDGDIDEQVKAAIFEYDVKEIGELAKDFVDSCISEEYLPDQEEITQSGDEAPVWYEPMTDKNGPSYAGFSQYVTADIDALFARFGSDFQIFVKEVLKVEAPLNERWFLKRIAHLFGRLAVSEDFVEEFDLKMTNCIVNQIIRHDGFLYLTEVSASRLRTPSSNCRRLIDEISLEELSVGLMTIINHNGKIDKDNLYRALIGKLGISKLTSVISMRLDKALLKLVAKISVDGTVISKI